VKTGLQTLVGAAGEVRADGVVFVNGELWRAHTSDGTRLLPGEGVEVKALEGLELIVKPVGNPASVS